jgi:hypothetical protein
VDPPVAAPVLAIVPVEAEPLPPTPDMPTAVPDVVPDVGFIDPVEAAPLAGGLVPLEDPVATLPEVGPPVLPVETDDPDPLCAPVDEQESARSPTMVKQGREIMNKRVLPAGRSLGPDRDGSSRNAFRFGVFSMPRFDYSEA